jgi:hypothetical protein
MRKRQVDEDVLALLREWELADEAERLAENGVCEMEDLEFMKEEDVQKFGLRLKFVGLLQHVTKQKEKRASGGSTEQNAEPTGSSAGDIAEPATGATERSELDAKSVRELREICRIKGIDSSTCLYKRDLVDLIISDQRHGGTSASARAIASQARPATQPPGMFSYSVSPSPGIFSYSATRASRVAPRTEYARQDLRGTLLLGATQEPRDTRRCACHSSGHAHT